MLFNGKLVFCNFPCYSMGIWGLRSFGGTYGHTYGRLEIHPCVLQDIGPLGPLPKKSVSILPVILRDLSTFDKLLYSDRRAIRSRSFLASRRFLPWTTSWRNGKNSGRANGRCYLGHKHFLAFARESTKLATLRSNGTRPALPITSRTLR